MSSPSLSQSPATRIHISTQKLGKRFNREWIFRDFNYQFDPGKIYAITGPNGSGKSTLLQVLWGQLPQTSGKLSYGNGQQIIPTEEIYRHVAIATPYMDLIEEFTLVEQLRFHFKLKKIRASFDVQKLLEIMSLSHAAEKTIGNFSSGMKQRVKLGLAFYTEASLLFLDEPGTNLDNQAFEWYYKGLLNVPKNCTIIIASNNPQEYPKTAEIVNISDFK